MAIPPLTGTPTRLSRPSVATAARRNLVFPLRPGFCMNSLSYPRPPEAACGENAPAIQQPRARRESSPERPEDAPIRRTIEMGSSLG